MRRGAAARAISHGEPASLRVARVSRAARAHRKLRARAPRGELGGGRALARARLERARRVALLAPPRELGLRLLLRAALPPAELDRGGRAAVARLREERRREVQTPIRRIYLPRARGG